MASAHVSQFDSDEEEFNYFTAGDIFQAEVRDLEKALEVDDLGSDIYVSDVSDTDLILIAQKVPGLLAPRRVTPTTTWYSLTSPDCAGVGIDAHCRRRLFLGPHLVRRP